MANNTARYGFRPHQTSAPGTLPIERFTVATGYQAQNDGAGFNVDLHIGDPVIVLAAGTVGLATVGVDVYGIIVGFSPYNVGGVLTPTDTLPGGTTWTTEDLKSEVLVVRASACDWEIDCDENTSNTTEAGYRLDINSNCNHACVGDTTAKEARPLLDISTSGTDEEKTWRIVGISQTAENQDFSGTRVKMLVRINSGSEPGTAATNEVGYE